MMKHTFLLEEGTWKAAGLYYNEMNTPVPVEGKLKIDHQEGLWINESSMFLTGTTIMFSNRYEIVPFPEEGGFTTWINLSPSIGKIRGKMVIVEDTIISSFISYDGRHTGYEVLVVQPEGVYKNRGILMKGKTRVSSWAIDLTKE